MEALIVALVMILVFGGGAYLAIRWFKGIANRGRELTLLASEGAGVTAKAIKVERQTRTRAGFDHIYVTYRFTDDQGRAFENRVSVTHRELNGLEEGGSFDIVYLPSDPSISAAESMVAKMREAQGERS